MRHEISLMPDRELPTVHDNLSSSSHRLLYSALKDYLPPDRMSRYGHMVDTTRFLPAGHHQVYFRPPTRDSELTEDGTDRRHAPDDSWKYRVWAGGQIQFVQPLIPLNNQKAAMLERIVGTSIAGDLTKLDSKVYVQIEKMISRKHILESGPDADSPLIIERRDLCFLRQIPPSLASPEAQRKVPPPAKAYYSHTLTPTPTLLFRFSALTYNAHAIHINPEFTKQEYGIPKLLVHGPLSLVLMLEVLRDALSRYEREYGTSPYIIREISYKNWAPLFVNEPMTICSKKVRDIPVPDSAPSPSPRGPWQEWQVWIQKGEGDGASLAVKGTVTVEPRTLEAQGII